MLSSPVGAVVGATDLDATVAFLELFDLQVTARDVVQATTAGALYGVPAELQEAVLGARGRERGTVRVVGGAAPAAPHGAYERGGHALDLYSRDLEQSLARVTDAGFRHGPVGHVVLGPLVMDQVAITGPDGLLVVLICSDRRRPSLLDDEPAALHSEAHSLVWAVPDLETALLPWREAPGLTVPFDAPVAHPEVARFMGLPDPADALRMAMVCDADVTPMRFELLEFLDREGSQRGDWPLQAGLHAVAFEVDDLGTAVADLGPSARPGTRAETESGAASCTVLMPGAVRLELREVSA